MILPLCVYVFVLLCYTDGLPQEQRASELHTLSNSNRPAAWSDVPPFGMIFAVSSRVLKPALPCYSAASVAHVASLCNSVAYAETGELAGLIRRDASLNSIFPPFAWPPDIGRLILDQGYPQEEHWIRTEDGYMLQVFRIARHRTKSYIPPVVLLQAGLLVRLCNAADICNHGGALLEHHR